MSPDQIIDIIRQTLLTAIQISAPLLIIAMAIGFTVSIFQSVTQINEMTLTFVPKIFVLVITLIVLFPWILKTIIKFTDKILIYYWEQVISLSSYA